ncbi:MAG TPA: hypothetical protein VIT41_13490 [Microlunatus sp.]
MRAVRVHAKLSATCLGLALTLGTLWWSAASTYVVLHDDALLVGGLARTLDQPAVRAQVGEWTGAAFDQAARLADDAEQTTATRQAVRQLQEVITSGGPVEPLITAVTGVVVATRDAAVTPLLTAAGARVAAVALPVSVVAGVLAVGFGAVQVFLLPRRRTGPGPIESES